MGKKGKQKIVCWEEYQVEERVRELKFWGRKSRLIRMGMGKNINL